MIAPQQCGRAVHIARAVRKVGHFGAVSPDGQGDRNNYWFTGLLRFLRSPETQMKPCFTPKTPDGGLNLLFLPRGRMLPSWWVVCRVVTGNPMY